MSEAKTPERAAKRPRADTASKTPGIPEGHMLFGIPKKGRLNEKCVAMLKGIGLDHKRANRLDYANCVGAPVTIVFLPAHDIARYIADGNVDMGITGQDIIAETECEGQVVELRQLGFGACKLAVEAPKGEYTSVEEVAGKRIVTSFPNLTRAYFSKLENGDKTTVTVVDGSVEVACALGLADAVVDLVESGTTMRAAGLEAIATIMTTEVRF
jgi:ATP phosphoribosyltransferase